MSWLSEVDHSRVRYVFLRSGREVVHTGSFALDGETATWKSMSGEVVMQADAIVGVELLEVQPKPAAVRKKRLRSAA
jgi:hypothetical protein